MASIASIDAEAGMLVDSTCITGTETATTASAVAVILVKDEGEYTIHTKEGGGEGGDSFADTGESKISTATMSEQGRVLGASDPDIMKENQQHQKEEEKMEGSNSTEPKENVIDVQHQQESISTQLSTSVASTSEPQDNIPIVAGGEERMDGSGSAEPQETNAVLQQQDASTSVQPSASVDSTAEPQEVIPSTANNDAADNQQQNQGKMEVSGAAEPQETNAALQQQDESTSVQPSASVDSTAEPQEIIPSTANNDAADKQQQKEGEVEGSDSAEPQDSDVIALREELSSVQPSASVDSTAETQEIITCTAKNDTADNQQSEEGRADGSDSAELHGYDTVVQQQQEEEVSSSAQPSTSVHSTAEPQNNIPSTVNYDAADNQQKEEGHVEGCNSAEPQELDTVVQQQDESSSVQLSASVDSTAEQQETIPLTVNNDAADYQQKEEGKMEGSDTAEPQDSDALAQQEESSTGHSAAPEICMADPQAGSPSKTNNNVADNRQQKEEVKMEGSDSEPQDSDVLVQQKGASSTAHSSASEVSAVEPQADSPSTANDDTEDKKQQAQEGKIEGSDSAENSDVLVQQQQESNSAQSTTSEVSATSTSEVSATEAHNNQSSSTTRDAATTATTNTTIISCSDRHENAPFHDLMIQSPGQHSESQLSLLEPMHMLLTDQKLRRDYLSRRFRAYRGTKRKQHQCTDKTNISTTTGLTKNNSMKEEDEATTTCVANGNTSTNSGRNSKYQRMRDSGGNNSNGYADSLWSGAKSLEIALIDCCELPPIEEDDATSAVKMATMETTVTASGEEAEGGSLARGYELQFASLVAKHCHTFSSRVLALAILERTLQQDIRESLEQEEAKNGDSNSQSMEENDIGQKEEQIGEDEQEKDQADGNSDEEDGDYVPNERTTRSKRKSKRIQKRKRGRPPKRAKTSSKDKVTKPTPASPTQSDTRVHAGPTNASKGEADEKPHQPGRMTVFFAAGGLKILRGWLMEAMTPVVTVMPPVEEDGLPDTENSPASKKASTPGKKYKPSQYGPMLLPMLVLLSKIPFDKTLIVESKINKQIRRLSKQVDGLIDAFKKKRTANQDLETFVDPEAGAGGCAVIRVQEILNKLKEIWEEHAKKDLSNQQQQPKIADPYNSIKTKLRERLGDLKDVTAGKIEKPVWLTRCEGLQKEQLEKRPRKNVVTRPVEKGNTQQLALKEREAERAALQDKLKAAQEERKAHLERLKMQINKRIQGAKLDVPTKRKKSSKTVKWKDGLSTDKIRKRDLLEVVHVVKYETEHTTPSLPEKSGKREEEVPPPEQDESATEDIMDEDGLFDFDETLLL